MSRLTEQLSQLLNIPINELNDLEVKSLQNNESFIVLLESSELAQEEEILKALSQVFRTQFVRLENMEISETIINLVPKDLAIKNHIIPIDRVGSNIVIAMSDTRNLNAIDSIRFATGYSTRAVLASDKRIQQALDKYYGKKMAFNVSSTENTNINNQVKVQDSRTIIGSTERGADTEAPAIKIVNELLVQCLQMKASDIHYEVYESTIRVRFRIDGVLHEIGRPPFY